MPDLQMSVLGDERVPAIESQAARLAAIDLSPLLVRAIDHVPAAALPWLAQQCNLAGPLWRYLADDTARRQAIKESVRWHRAKGTPWAVETALSWAGLAARVEDGTATARRWAEYQLEMSAPLEPARTADVVALARFGAPARARLVRIYGSYDLRPAQYDARAWDGAMWDADSGVEVDGVRVSFAARYASAAPALPRHAAAGLHTLQLSSARRRTAAWDGWRWDEPQRLRDAGSTLSRQLGAATPAPVRRLVVTLSVRTTSPQLSCATRMAVPQLSTRHDTDALKPRRGWSGPWRGRVRRTAASNLTFLTE